MRKKKISKVEKKTHVPIRPLSSDSPQLTVSNILIIENLPR